MSIVLMDTSVFCNVINVPGRNQDHERTISALNEHIKAGATLLLPMAVVLETGNHVANAKVDGRERRNVAARFRDNVLAALDGSAPWTPTPFWEETNLKVWLENFPDEAMKGIGMGDLSIRMEWERQCGLHRRRHVLIWSLDSDLQGYEQRGRY